MVWMVGAHDILNGAAKWPSKFPQNTRPSVYWEARYEDLAERNTEGQLSPAEQNELASIVRANSLLTVLKAEARAFLQHPNAA
jgi:hypothetical protein